MLRLLASAFRLFYRSAKVIPSSLGGTWFGIVVFPIVVFFVTLAITLYRHGEAMNLLKDAGFSLVIALASLGVVFIGCIIATIYREHLTLVARVAKLKSDLNEVFLPIQFEAFSLARDLRDFHSELGPFPQSAPRSANETTEEFISKKMMLAFEEGATWSEKLVHGYANRKLGQRITSLMHRAAEEYGYPAHVPDYAERINPTEDALPKLAQQMEMVAIWINRQQRDEVNLLQ